MPAADHPRDPRVGLRAQGKPGVAAQLPEDTEQPLRSEGAVGPEDGDRQPAQGDRHLARALSTERPPVVREGHLRDDGQLAQLVGDLHGLDHLVQVSERLEDEQLDATLEQRLHLLPERFHALAGADPASLPERRRRRDRAGHEDLPARGRLRLQGEAGAFPVDQPGLVGAAVHGQPEWGGAEGVGLDHVRPAGHVALVDRPHQPRVGEVQLRQRTVQRHAGAVEHGSHGPVADQEALRHRVTEGGHRVPSSASRISSATCAIRRSW